MMNNLNMDSMITYYALSEANPEAGLGFAYACLMENFGKKNSGSAR